MEVRTNELNGMNNNLYFRLSVKATQKATRKLKIIIDSVK